MHPTYIRVLVAAVLVSTANAVDPESWVRQTDLANGMVYDIHLSATGGNFQAPLPVSETGSTFELFARGTAWDTKIYHLDTKLIRAYTPTVVAQITSEDSYVRGVPNTSNYVRRTRADRPFSLSIQVSGLIPSSGSKAEREVYFSTHKRTYDPLTYSALNQPQVQLGETNLGNGTVSMTGLYHQLGGTPLSAGCGEHTYTFVRYAADGVPDTTLVQPKIEIWPLATATIENITAGQVFTDRIPPLVLTLKALYPDSRTFAQVYPGQAVLGTNGNLVKGTERKFGAYYNPGIPEATTTPQDQAITIDDLSNYAAADGIYTLEVITATPFFNRAPERLLAVSFEVDRVISSRGQLGTAEP